MYVAGVPCCSTAKTAEALTRMPRVTATPSFGPDRGKRLTPTLVGSSGSSGSMA